MYIVLFHVCYGSLGNAHQYAVFQAVHHDDGLWKGAAFKKIILAMYMRQPYSWDAYADVTCFLPCDIFLQAHVLAIYVTS